MPSVHTDAGAATVSSATPDGPRRAGSLHGGLWLTMSLVLTVLTSLAADFNASHLFNPAWPAHAKFHGAAMLHLLTGTAALALWLLWRRSPEPDVAALVAWLLPSIFWSPFFWITSALPEASLRAFPDQAGPPLQVGGTEVLPIVVAAFALIAMSTFGFWLHRRGRAHPPADPQTARSSS